MFTLKVIFIATCLLGIRISTGVDYSDCPDGFEHIAEVNVCLKPIFEVLIWDDSSRRCESLAPGAHLAVITSQEEHDAVVSFMKRKVNDRNRYIWNDHYSSGSDRGKFREPEEVKCRPDDHDEIDGSSFWLAGSSTNFYQCHVPYDWRFLLWLEIPMTFTSWHGGQPDCLGDGGSKNCVLINSNAEFQWVTGNCALAYCSLCEV